MHRPRLSRETALHPTMKTSLLALLALITGTALAGTVAPQPLATDDATQLLRHHGAITIAKAGSHVEAGTFRVQVAAKLGRPDETLPDGTWLYHGRRVTGSEATGTLIVRFTAGRVQGLSLLTPQAVVALRNLAEPKAGQHFVATP